MDLQTRKIHFVQEFLNLQSEEAIVQFEKLLKNKKIKKAEEHFIPMSVADLHDRISRSENDFKNKKYKSASELLKKFQS